MKFNEALMKGSPFAVRKTASTLSGVSKDCMADCVPKPSCASMCGAAAEDCIATCKQPYKDSVHNFEKMFFKSEEPAEEE